MEEQFDIPLPSFSVVPSTLLHHYKYSEVSHARFWAAYVCFDIAGFTNLSNIHTKEDFTRIIGLYFNEIINEIIKYDGDIIKFTGDGFQVVWRTPNNDPLRGLQPAMHCANSVTSRFSFSSDIDARFNGLSIRAGVSFGEFLGLDVNYSYKAKSITRSEYFIVGEPFVEGNNCEAAFKDFRKKNENWVGFFITRALYDKYADILSFVSRQDLFLFSDSDDSPPIEYYPCKVSFYPTHSLYSKRRFTSPISDAEKELIIKHTHTSARGVQSGDERYGTFCSSVTMFTKFVFNPHQTIESTSSTASLDMELYRLFRNNESPECNEEGFVINRSEEEFNSDREKHKHFTIIFQIIGKRLRENNGELRQFIFDDKGIVSICSFGLSRGSEGLEETIRDALRASAQLRSIIRESSDHGVLSQKYFAYCTTGMAYDGANLSDGGSYCGMVGNENREEFMILGKYPLLAARLAFYNREHHELATKHSKDAIWCINFDPFLDPKFEYFEDSKKEIKAELKGFEGVSLPMIREVKDSLTGLEF